MSYEVHVDEGEPPDRDWNLRNSRTNMLLNLTSLALDVGSGPGKDISRESSSRAELEPEDVEILLRGQKRLWRGWRPH